MTALGRLLPMVSGGIFPELATGYRRKGKDLPVPASREFDMG